MLCAGVAALRVTLATPRCSSSSGGAASAVLGPPCGMQQHSRTRRSWALYDCQRSQKRGGASRVLAHLEVWAPNMFPAEAEPLPAAAFDPPAWPEDSLDPPPPPLHPTLRGGGTFRASSNRRTPLGSLRPRCSPPDPPRIQGNGWSLCYGRLQ